ncbi:hypothetical protein EV177_007121 [Coemansia sp. RSA 1804]|nr:hypothetical protein EV177_007121 [Coemansia sp. RSA 1804]
MGDQRPRIGAGSTWINMRRGSQNRRAFQGEDRDDEGNTASDSRRINQASYAELMRVYGRLGSRASPHTLTIFGNQGSDDSFEQSDDRDHSERYDRERGYSGQADADDNNDDGGSAGGSDNSEEDRGSAHGSDDQHDLAVRYGRHAGSSDDDGDDVDEDDDNDDEDEDDAEMAESHDGNTTGESENEADNASNDDYDGSEVYNAYRDNYEHIFGSAMIGASYEDLPSLIAGASRQAETRQVGKQTHHKDSPSRLSFMPRYLENTAYGALYRKSARNGYSRGRVGRLNGASGRGASALDSTDINQRSMVSTITPDVFFKTLVQDTWPHYCTPGPAIPTSFAGLQLGGYGLGIPSDRATQPQSSSENTIAQQDTSVLNRQPRHRDSPEDAPTAAAQKRTASGKVEGLRLPSEWAPLRNSHNISIDSDRVTIHYTGPGRQDNDAAMVVTDACIPTRTGVYYFEVYIKSRGQSGYIGVGFSRSGLNIHRLPGWDIGSWGYHGDDGNVFGGDGRGTGYGPRFTTGDTVGCGIDFMRQRIFFTRNGFFLGYAFGVIDTSKDLFPCIGMRTPGEHATANFGRKPFVFDIDNYAETAHDDALKTVRKTPLGPLVSSDKSETPNGANHNMDLELVQMSDLLKIRGERHNAIPEKNRAGWPDATLGMVVSYLIHNEHYATARALIKNAMGLGSADGNLDGKSGCEHLVTVLDKISSLDAQRNSRRQISKHICDGEIDYALGLLQESYPRVLEDESLVFQLRCRQFIELVRSASGCQIADCVPNDDSQLAVPAPYMNAEEKSSHGTSGDMMDVDDTNSSSVLSLAAVTNAPAALNRRARFGQIRNLRKMEPAQLVRVLLEYGRQLQADYGSSPNQIIREGLVHTFSLLAYADPAQSPIAALLDPSACKPLARLVEMAISASEGAPRTTSLENVSRQTGALLNELSTLRNGAASLISLERDFLKVAGGADNSSSKGDNASAD